MKKSNVIHGLLKTAIVLGSFSLFLNHSSWMWIVVGLQAAGLIYFFRIDRASFTHMLFWPMFSIGLLALPWPLHFICPIAVYLVVVLPFPRLRKEVDWLKIGEFNGKTVWLMFTTVFTSSCALILWVILFKPDLADLIVMVPADSVPVIICVGLLFSTGNAIWEEIIFRGILWNGLQKAYGNIIVLVVFQAVLFSLLHIGGFPRGAVGVILAGVYGAAIGVIRMFSKGLAAPVITHFFADATIFGILVAMKI